MKVIPPTDLSYDVTVQETPVADLLLLDDSVNPPWEQSFTSLLMGGDQQIAPPALSGADQQIRVNSQSTLEDSSVSYNFSMLKQQGPHLFSSEEEEAKFLASMGLGKSTSSDEDYSWSTVEEQMLRGAMADNILMHPIIPWQRIADALPWRAPLEVFNRAKQLLQSIQRDLSTVMSQQQQQQQQVGFIMSPPPPPPEEKEKQQQVRKRWSKEEDDNFWVGVKRHGWGNWKMVATLIPGRTVAQVTSHAQKYITKQNNNHPIMPKRRRMN